MPDPVIAVIGSSNTDLVVRVPHIPAPGETVLGGDLVHAPGGKGANQAVAARRLGAEVAFVGCVGDDSLGDAAMVDLAREGLRLDHLTRLPGVPSGVAFITVAESGANSIVVAPGANAHLAPDMLDNATETIQSASLVLAQLEVPLATVARAFFIAHTAGARTLLNPAPAQALPPDLLALVDVLVCNETEAATLTGSAITDRASAETAAHSLRASGPPLIIITLGGDGCIILDGDIIKHVPAYTVPVVDTTAAGDVFIGAFAVQLAQGAAPGDAARYATAAAALCVGVLGAQPSLPTRGDVAQFLQRTVETTP